MIKNKKFLISLLGLSIYSLVNSNNIVSANEVEVSSNPKQVKTVQKMDVSSRGLGIASPGEVIADELNIRSGPGTNYTIIDSISKGHAVQVTDYTKGWSYIIYTDGGTQKRGWAASRYIRLAP